MTPKRTEDRRQEIVMAAFQAFTENGYDKTSMDEIVRMSGLSKGTLYWYFKSKQELYAAVLSMVMEGYGTAFDQTLEQTVEQNAADRLRAVVIQTQREVVDNPQFMALITDFFTQAWQLEFIQGAFTQFYQSFMTSLAEIIQQGINEGLFRAVDPHQTASAFVGSLDGIMLQTLLDHDWEIGAVIELWGDIFVRGLMKGAST